MASRFAAWAASAVLLFTCGVARADRIAILPSGGLDAQARDALTQELARGIVAQAHTLIPGPDVAAATAAEVKDGVVDTLEEFVAVGKHTGADWVVGGTITPAAGTARVELSTCLVSAGRTESVARDVDIARFAVQVREMITVLLRVEGVGTGALPWERSEPTPVPPPPPPPPAAPPTPTAPPVDGRARIAYPAGADPNAWPPYGSRRGFVTGVLGVAAPVSRPNIPAGTVGSGTSLVGAIRGGYAVGDLGFEPVAEFGGNLFGPRALWLTAGGRWMFAPALHRGADGVLEGIPLFFGPRLSAGVFVELGTQPAVGANGISYSAAASSHGLVGAAADVAYALSPAFYLEANLGNLMYLPGSGGSTLIMGATLAGTLRF